MNEVGLHHSFAPPCEILPTANIICRAFPKYTLTIAISWATKETVEPIEEKAMKPTRMFVLPALLVLLSILLSAGPSGAVLPAHAAPMQAVGDFNILLGRPTDHSITINMIPDLSGEVAFEYSTTSGTYGDQTAVLASTSGTPVETVIDGLSGNTQYFYRVRYRANSSAPRK